MNLKNLIIIKNLIGKKILRFLLITIITGALLFIVEYLFIYSLQGFLISIGVSSSNMMALPSWMPSNNNFFFYLLIFVGISRSALLQFKIYISRLTNQFFLRRFRNTILSNAIANSPHISSHETLSLFTDTLSRAGSVIVEGTSITITLFTTLLLIIVGFTKAPHEMGLGLFFLMFLVIPIKLLGSISQKYGTELSKSWEKATKTLLEGIKHHFFFRIHGLISRKVNQGLEQIKAYESHYKSYFLITGVKNTLPQSLGVLLVVGLSYLGINYFNTEPANLLAFLYIFLRISQAASEVFTLSNNINLNIPSLIQLQAWVKNTEIFPTIPSPTSIKHDFTIRSLNTKELSFSYSKETLLKNININLYVGDVLLIDGPSGRGKSTLISLLMNILKPTSGQVLLNEKNIEDAPQYFRNAISYVGSDPFLFEDTVRENLLYGHPHKEDITDLQIWNTLNYVNADKFINAFPNKLDENLNEYTQLSTGQKQRLSLARAILRKPDILILDEATANLDHDTEIQIKEKLNDIIKDKICILIAHKGEFKSIATKKINL